MQTEKKAQKKYKAAGIGTFEKLHLEDCQMRSINDERGESHFTMIQRLFEVAFLIFQTVDT